MTSEDIGSTTIETISIRLLQGDGFSNGWVEFGPKNPPPLVPSCLIATSAATGPRAIVWVSILVGRAVERGRLRRPLEGHRHRRCRPAATATIRASGHEDEDQAPHQVDIEVAQVLVAPQAAERRQHHAQAGRRA